MRIKNMRTMLLALVLVIATAMPAFADSRYSEENLRNILSPWAEESVNIAEVSKWLNGNLLNLEVGIHEENHFNTMQGHVDKWRNYYDGSAYPSISYSFYDFNDLYAVYTSGDWSITVSDKNVPMTNTIYAYINPTVYATYVNTDEFLLLNEYWSYAKAVVTAIDVYEYMNANPNMYYYETYNAAKLVEMRFECLATIRQLLAQYQLPYEYMEVINFCDAQVYARTTTMFSNHYNMYMNVPLNTGWYYGETFNEAYYNWY